MSTASPTQKALRYARHVSDILNPLVLPVAVFATAAIKLESNTASILKVTGIGFLFFTLLPLLILLIMKRAGHIDHIEVPAQSRRSRPFVYGLFCMLLGSIVFSESGLEHAVVYQAFALVSVVNGSFAALINLRWKISIHAMGMSTAAVLFVFLSGSNPLLWPEATPSLFLLTALLIAITVLVQWSRVVLQQHSVGQVIAGGTLAATLTILQLILYFPEVDISLFT